jgi:hypothetical protein
MPVSVCLLPCAFGCLPGHLGLVQSPGFFTPSPTIKGKGASQCGQVGCSTLTVGKIAPSPKRSYRDFAVAARYGAPTEAYAATFLKFCAFVRRVIIYLARGRPRTKPLRELCVKAPAESGQGADSTGARVDALTGASLTERFRVAPMKTTLLGSSY